MTEHSTYTSDVDRALALIRECPSGPQGWTLFYRAMVRRIRAQLFMLGERRTDRLDDLTQETLTRFVGYCPWREDWRTLPEAQSVIAYIRKVTRTVFLDDRKRRAPEEHFTSSTGAGQPAAAEVDELEGTIDDLNRGLRRTAASLGAADRLLLRLLLDGRSIADIAAVLGIEYSAAAVRIHRLKKRIQASWR